MKYIKWIVCFAATLVISMGGAAQAADQVDTSTLIGKVITGYQGWFRVPGKSSADTRWQHWGGLIPAPGRQTFDIWPDTSEYNADALADTLYSPLSSGKPAQLYGTQEVGVVDTHFQWLKEYEIDGVAVQRFLGGDMGFRDTVLAQVLPAAEKYGRGLYIMYDTSGGGSDYVKKIQTDLETKLESKEGLFSSNSYFHQNGKPVICVWGIGFSDRPGSPEEALGLIQWLKGKGYFVVGGVPSSWRNISEYEEVWKALDMLSPWTVGQRNPDAYAQDHLIGDIEKTAAMGVVYQPVVFSGFSWYLSLIHI